MKVVTERLSSQFSHIQCGVDIDHVSATTDASAGQRVIIVQHKSGKKETFDHVILGKQTYIHPADWNISHR